MWPAGVYILSCIFACGLSIEISEETKQTCLTLLKKYDEDPSATGLSGIIENGICPNADVFNLSDYFLPKLLIWCPVTRFRISQTCPDHNILLKPGPWKLSQKVNGDPRLLLDVNGNALLLSRYYVCSTRGIYHRILSCDSRLLTQLPDFIEIPFTISHRSCCTLRYITFVMVQIGHGVNFNEIATCLDQLNFEDFCRRKRQYILICARNNILPLTKYLDNKAFETGPQYTGATDNYLRDLFLRNFRQQQELYEDDMATLTACSISMDHTFKISKNIGAARIADQKWVTQYGSLFAALNENGEIVKWLLCSGESFEEIKLSLCELRDRLQKQGNQLTHAMVDICCKRRTKLQGVFGEGILVKLDLFHVVQRLTNKIPKRCRYRQDCINDFSLVFRQPHDTGKTRTEATPSPNIIMKQLDEFVKKWCKSSELGLINEAAMKEIYNLKQHITKGCLSGIPVGHGTQRNEGLHRLINRSVVTGASRIGVELAFALLTVLFHISNSKIRKKQTHSRVPLLMSSPIGIPTVKNAERVEHFGLLPNKLVVGDSCHTSRPTPDEDMTFTHLDVRKVKEVKQLFCEKTLIPMALNLHEVLSNIARVCKSKNTNPWDFPMFQSNDLMCLLSGRFENNISEEEILHTQRIDRRLAGFNRLIESVDKDGNCAFTAIGCQISRLFDNDLTPQLVDYLATINLKASQPVCVVAQTLRNLFVQELLSNSSEYFPQTFNMTGDEYELAAVEFHKDGVYSTQLGDFVMKAMSNVLGCAIVVITSMVSIEVIPFIPQTVRCKEALYVVYNQYGSGHYDSTIRSVVEKTTDLVDKDSSKQSGIGQDRCRCGRDKVKTNPAYIACSNVNTVKQYATRCPCHKAGFGCTVKCRCINCANENGTRVQDSKIEVSGSGSRNRYILTSNKRKRSEEYMESKSQEIQQGGWSSFETSMFEAIMQLVSQTAVDPNAENIYLIYQHVAGSQTLNKLGLNLRDKTLKHVVAKMSHRKQRANLSSVFTAQQLRNALSDVPFEKNSVDGK